MCSLDHCAPALVADLFREDVTWLDALQRCPLAMPGSMLARVFTDSDYQTMASLLVREFPNPVDIYQGAWIGLNAIDAADPSSPYHVGDQTTPSVPGIGAHGWRWSFATDRNGAGFATPDCLAALVAACATAAVVGCDPRSIVDNSSYRRRLVGTVLAVLCFAISDELAHALVHGIGAA